MDQFEVLGELARKLHGEFRTLYFVLLPVFFAVSLIFAWFRHPAGGPDFVESLKRTVISTLLLVGFQEISDAILFIADGVAEKISDMRGLDLFTTMASEKTKNYTSAAKLIILGFNDLLVAILSYASFIVLYFARYIMVALYHFSWVFLSLIAPMLLLFHMFSPKITFNLFRSLIEVASWKVVWATLSAILLALPFGNAYMMDGNYLTVIILNFVVALCMLGTPLVVRSLIGSGLSAMTSSMSPIALGAMIATPNKIGAAKKMAKTVLSDTKGYAQYQAAKFSNSKVLQSRTSLARPPTAPPVIRPKNK